MKILKITLAIILFLIIVKLPCKAQLANKNILDQYIGIWKTQRIGSGNISITTYYIFKETEKKLSGSIIVNNSMEISMDNLKQLDSVVTFTISWGASYIIYPESDQLIIKTSWNGRDYEKAFAIRVDVEELKILKVLPLPEKKKVPYNNLVSTPPMGWNSWNHFNSKIDDKTVREIADAMVSSGMADAGYQYVVIDDTWAGGRDSLGNIIPNEKFPDMKALADYVHSKGLKLGIYSSPGMKTCGGYEGSYGHEYQDAKTFAQWGIDFLKYDWCGAMRFYPDSLMYLVYQKMGQALYECGRPIVYNICQYGVEKVWEWAPAAGGNTWRTTGDINSSWERITDIGFSQSNLAQYARPGYWNDPDMLEVGNGNLSYEQNKSHFTLWCMLAAPLITGNDLRNMSDDTRSILTNKDVISINQDKLGKQGIRIYCKDSIEVWKKELSQGYSALAVFNRNKESKQFTLKVKELGYSENQLFKEIWSQKIMKQTKGILNLSIPAYGVLLLKTK